MVKLSKERPLDQLPEYLSLGCPRSILSQTIAHSTSVKKTLFERTPYLVWLPGRRVSWNLTWKFVHHHWFAWLDHPIYAFRKKSNPVPAFEQKALFVNLEPNFHQLLQLNWLSKLLWLLVPQYSRQTWRPDDAEDRLSTGISEILLLELLSIRANHPVSCGQPNISSQYWRIEIDASRLMTSVNTLVIEPRQSGTWMLK